MDKKGIGEYDSDAPGFGIGKVRGYRSFRVLPDGRLTGVVYKRPYKRDVNVAGCEGMQEATHPMRICSHGFYAYYKGSNDYHYPYSGQVAGVVDGWGEVIVGSRGFRAQKVRIVALHLPGGAKTAWPFVNWLRNRALAGRGLGFIGIPAMSIGMMLAIYSIPVWLSSNLPLVAALMVGVAPVGVYLGVQALRVELEAIGDLHGLSPRTLERIKKRYPDAVIFNRWEDMLEAFPPDRGAERRNKNLEFG